MTTTVDLIYLATRRSAAAALALLLLAAAPAFAQTPAAAPASPAPSAAVADPDPILVSNSTTQIRKSDYDLELQRLPADMRAGFANNKRRIGELLARMLVTKTLAAQAFAEKLDQDPEVAARFESEVERYFAGARVALFERATAAEFDAKKASYEARARELYLADTKRFELPEQVRVSHILYKLGPHTKEEGETLARNARAKILAGEDFGAFAMQFSEDGSAMNKGQLDWMGRAELDPAFAAAAFALKKPGDISEPVLSQFGWHLIKLDDRRAAGPRPYEEVRPLILAEMKKAYVDEKKAALLNSINQDPTGKVNEAAVDALYIEPPAVEATPKSPPSARKAARTGKPDKDADTAPAEFARKAAERAKHRAATAGTEAAPPKN